MKGKTKKIKERRNNDKHIRNLIIYFRYIYKTHFQELINYHSYISYLIFFYRNGLERLFSEMGIKEKGKKSDINTLINTYRS